MNRQPRCFHEPAAALVSRTGSRVVFAVFCAQRKIELPSGQFKQKQCQQRAFVYAAKQRARKPLRFTKKPLRKAQELFCKTGGRGWIRTTEAKRNRFTVCPLWPLGNAPIYEVKAEALTNELPRSPKRKREIRAGGRT